MSMTTPSPLLDDVVTRLGVRHRAPGAGGDNRREGEALGAVLAGVLLDLPGDLLLGPARLHHRRDVLEGGVPQRDGAAEGLDLFRLLDHAHGFDEAVGRHEAADGPTRQLFDRGTAGLRNMP